MKIEIFPSASGDCVLVTSGDGRHRLLADAGLPDAYDAFIAAPLAKLREAGEAIDVAYVSHIDRDHIGGILRLLDDEVAWRAFEVSQRSGGRRREPKVPRPPEIRQIWHNAFLEDIERTEAISLGGTLAASAGLLAGLNAAGLGGAEAREIASTAQMLALSVGDAIEVNWRIGADQLDIPLNPDFGGKFMTARPDKPISVGSLEISVLGPTSEELVELRKEWIGWLRKNAKRLATLRAQHARDAGELGAGATPLDFASVSRNIALAVEKDVTPPNLASMVLLVEENGRRLLLCGDAGDQTLLKHLANANLLDANGGIEVDVLKVPHHGAFNSFSPTFARAVRARHLIFCGDGEHDNPEHGVVKGYIDAVKAAPLSGGRTTTFWFNWSLARAARFQPHWEKLEKMFDSSTEAAGIRLKSLGKTQASMSLTID